ncbi:MAG: PP0621 family protein [Casimicrobiaceae bacterium]
MGKVIMWVVIVFAVLFVLRMINVAAAARKRRESAPPPPPEGKALMVKCVECGVYLPKAEARRGPSGPCCGDDACRERAKQAR